MSRHFFFVGEKYHQLSIGRNVWKPVVVIVGEHLFLIAPVSLHAPNQHMPAALGVEINVLAIGRILGAIVKTFRGRQPSFISACGWNRVDVELVVALANKGEGLAIRRPSM